MTGTLQFLEQALTGTRRPLTQPRNPVLQIEATVRKNLNIKEAHTSQNVVSFSDSVVEHLNTALLLQVMKCRVKLAAAGLEKKVLWREDLRNLELSPQQLASRQLDFAAIVGSRPNSDEERAVGFCAQFVENGQEVLFLKSYGCQLELDHMPLGRSTKKGNPDLAGTHSLAPPLSRQDSANAHRSSP